MQIHKVIQRRIRGRRDGGEHLPDREAMSLIDANVATPVSAAAAMNVLSEDSTAVANAEQTSDIHQTGP